MEVHNMEDLDLTLEALTLPDPAVLNAVSAFVSDLVRSESYYHEPCPITRTEAAYTLRQLAADGVDLPAGITPEMFCYYWNSFCDSSYYEF